MSCRKDNGKVFCRCGSTTHLLTYLLTYKSDRGAQLPWRVSPVRLSLPSARAALARLSADASSSRARMYNTSCSIRRCPSPMNTVEHASVATATTAAAGGPVQHMASSPNTDSASGELRERAICMMDVLRSRTNSNFNRSSLCSR